MRIQGRHWLASVAIAVALHAALLLGLGLGGSTSVGSGGGVRIALGEAIGAPDGGPVGPEAAALPEVAPAPAVPPAEPVPVASPPEPAPRVEAALPQATPSPPLHEPTPRREAAAPLETRGAPEGPASPSAEPVGAAVAAAGGHGASEPGRASAVAAGEKGLDGLDPDYVRRFMARLERYKHYPRAARVHQLEGTALLWLRVDRGGRVLAYDVEESSGHRLLDRAVLRAIERASPMPPLPANYPRTELELVVPIAFRLQ